MGIFIQFASVMAFTGWALYLWIHAKDFGSQPQCNDQVKYVLMFVNVRATAPWLRGIWITTLVASALWLMAIFGINGYSLYTMRTDEEEERTEGSGGWYFFMSFSQILCVIRFSPVKCSLITE